MTTSFDVTREPVFTDVARDFLNSAVVFDDLAHMIMEDGVDPSSLVAPNYGIAVENDTGGETPKDSRGIGLDANAIIRAFAEIGTVCTVLKPRPDDSGIVTEAAEIAAKADVVVLDWKIHDSLGEMTLDILSRILEYDQYRHRLRLIAIYTGEPGVDEIRARVTETLERFYPMSELGSTRHSVSKGPVRVMMLSKGASDRTPSQDRTPPQAGSTTVTERELPQALLTEFASMTDGLLPTVALSALTAIRNGVHMVLTKFDRRLDAAYLGHRLLLPYPPDAEDHLISALGAELLSVLENSQSGQHADINAIDLWLRARRSLLQREDVLGFGAGADEIAHWKELLLRGADYDGIRLPVGGKSSVVSRGTEVFADSPQEALFSARSFSVLLQLRTRHPDVVPRLRLGSIIKRELKRRTEYLLCLQPKCDSVRLQGWSGFPFLPLTSVRRDFHKKRFRIALEIENGNWLHFDFDAKPAELINREFQPTAQRPGEIVAELQDEDQFVFQDRRKNRYLWMAEMKEEHALGIAAEVASSLARPGPDDSEWLRRAARRKKLPN